MSVKKKDRHVSKNDCLGKTRILTHQILIVTRPALYNQTGKKIRRAGLLGEGQPLQAFGLDILHCSKQIHGVCYEASRIHLKDEETLNARTALYQQGIKYCRSILRQLDMCIFEYASESKKKRKSFNYIARLVYDVIQSIQDRINRDNLIYKQDYKVDKPKMRRYR